MVIAWSLDNDRLEYQLMKGAGVVCVGGIQRLYVCTDRWMMWCDGKEWTYGIGTVICKALYWEDVSGIGREYWDVYTGRRRRDNRF